MKLKEDEAEEKDANEREGEGRKRSVSKMGDERMRKRSGVENWN